MLTGEELRRMREAAGLMRRELADLLGLEVAVVKLASAAWRVTTMRDDRGTSLLDELARESRDVVADAHEQWLVLAPRCHREGHVHVDLGDACNPRPAGRRRQAGHH
jgi:transcriptional regulator with XRE-family HTH domain